MNTGLLVYNRFKGLLIMIVTPFNTAKIGRTKMKMESSLWIKADFDFLILLLKDL